MHDHDHTVSHPTKMAVSATLHCLTGCAIGEILGMVVGSAWGLSNFVTVVISIALAFVFGYSLSLFSVLRSGVPLKNALRLVLIADTLSISVKTVDTHRGHVLKKLRLRNNSDITRFAISNGLIPV